MCSTLYPIKQVQVVRDYTCRKEFLAECDENIRSIVDARQQDRLVQ